MDRHPISGRSSGRLVSLSLRDPDSRWTHPCGLQFVHIGRQVHAARGISGGVDYGTGRLSRRFFPTRHSATLIRILVGTTKYCCIARNTAALTANGMESPVAIQPKHSRQSGVEGSQSSRAVGGCHGFSDTWLLHQQQGQLHSAAVSEDGEWQSVTDAVMQFEMSVELL